MQNPSHKHSPLTAQSLSPLVLSCSSLWNSGDQAKCSSAKGIAAGCGSSPSLSDHMKQSESQFQEQDSSSTLSTCQSLYAMGNTARNNSMVQNHGSKHEHQNKSSLPYWNADYAFGQMQFDYNHNMTCVPYQWAESCFGALIAAYGPNALVYPQMMGFNQARVPIPLDCAEDVPVYVNTKQFRAILRRRQMRAKLEAQNKIAKSRKPYLHESRHIHALKRPRGSGGRFLNAKQSDKSKPSVPTHSEDMACQRLGGDLSSGTEVQHSNSCSWETSTPSSSDVTSIFSGDDIFQQREIRLSRSSFNMDAHVGEDLPHLEAGNRLFSTIKGGAPK
ncbi:hypothetical protein M9H77_19497 [Catharanthus roseus]|uniref:Uncharacterized protein n=2 Tax=Catharanthus roseus TaxID=4058 RepID=A0ACC0BAG7_CATRO|nr:hypothetical protein M9H77_19497 [Catharanthus roseus]QTJ02278.1 NYF-YA type transcription factor [Catharanthus roseus]